MNKLGTPTGQLEIGAKQTKIFGSVRSQINIVIIIIVLYCILHSLLAIDGELVPRTRCMRLIGYIKGETRRQVH